jgi:serine/threonine protein kinase
MLSHRSIIKLYQAFILGKDLLLLMEYAEGGELMAYITEKEGLDELEGRFLFR